MKLTDEKIIEALKAGKKIRRPEWDKEDYYKLRGNHLENMDFADIFYDIDELAADDWQIVEETNG